jgi:ADP-ribosyl-[dinitrogen reductase] hydrolase
LGIRSLELVPGGVALLAVNLGDDADTSGAIYGQIAGAFYSADGIPAEWKAKVTMHELIIGLADRFYALVNRSS